MRRKEETPNYKLSLIEFRGTQELGFSYQATGINNSGVIVGYYGNVENTEQNSFIYQNGTIATFLVPDSLNTLIKSINIKGEIAGQFTDANGSYIGFINSDNNLEKIIIPDSLGTIVECVSNNGNIAGLFLDKRERVKGFSRKKRENFQIIEYPRQQHTFVTGINNAGLVIGDFPDEKGNYQSFILDKDKFELINFPNAVSTFVTDINNSNVISGVYLDRPGNTGLNGKGFLYYYNTKKFESINFPTAPATLIGSISDSGLITGFASWSAAGCRGKSAFIGIRE
jgi:probable HAF family extracellular repeat protein